MHTQAPHPNSILNPHPRPRPAADGTGNGNGNGNGYPYPDLDFPLASLIRKLDRRLQPIGIPKKTKYLVDDPILHAFGGLRNFAILSTHHIEYKSGVARLLLPLHSIPHRVFQLPHLLAFDLCYYVNSRGGAVPLAAVEATFARHTALATVHDIVAKYKKIFQVHHPAADAVDATVGPVLQVVSLGPQVLPFMLARKFADAFVNNAALITSSAAPSTSSSATVPLPPPTSSLVQVSTSTATVAVAGDSASVTATASTIYAPSHVPVSPPRPPLVPPPSLPYTRIHMDPSDWASSPTAHLDDLPAVPVSTSTSTSDDAESLPQSQPEPPPPLPHSSHIIDHHQHSGNDTDTTTHDGDLTTDSIPPFASLPPLPETEAEDDTASSSAFDDTSSSIIFTSSSSSAPPPTSSTPDPVPPPPALARRDTTPSPRPSLPRSSSSSRPTPTFSSPSKLPPALKPSPTDLSTSTIRPTKPVPTPAPAPAPAPTPPLPPSLNPLSHTLPKIDHRRHYLYILQSGAHADAFRALHLSSPTLPRRIALDITTNPASGTPDLATLSFPDPGSTYRSVVAIWDFARAHAEEHVRMRIELRGVIKSIVSTDHGEVVVHGAQRLSRPALVGRTPGGGAGGRWIDPSWPLVDTNVVYQSWRTMASDAHALAAEIDLHAARAGGLGEFGVAAGALRMTGARRARWLAPVLDVGTGTSKAVVELNEVLRACQRRTSEVRDKVDEWIEERARRGPIVAAKRPASETDVAQTASGCGGMGVVRTATGGLLPAARPLQPRDPSALASPATRGNTYWDLHPDTALLARAAAQDVDQLVVVADMMEQRMDELAKWMRRVKSYLALTEYARSEWSVDPKLPRHVAVQARFDCESRLAWRYPCEGVDVDDEADDEEDEGPHVSADLRDIHDHFAARTAAEVADLLQLLPDPIQHAIRRIPNGAATLNEVIMDYGERPRLRFFGREKASVMLKDLPPVTYADIDAIIAGRKFSSDRRGGINGQLHRISWMANWNGQAVGLTVRVGRACAPGEGVTQMLLDLVKRGESVLVLGKPGSGKTHTLRDLVARLSDLGNNVMVVDTSNEVGGPGDSKHFSLHNARRMQVRDRARQFEVLLEAVQNHTPDIVCVDEISDAKEVAAARSVATRVQSMVATAHGSLESVLRNKELRHLVGGLQTVVIGDARAREMGGRKTLTTRIEESLFTSVVELVSRTEVRVFRNVSRTIDDILHPMRQPWAERRWLEPVPEPVQELAEPVKIGPSNAEAGPRRPVANGKHGRALDSSTSSTTSASASNDGDASDSVDDESTRSGRERKTDDSSSESLGDNEKEQEDEECATIRRRPNAHRHFWVRVEPFANVDLESIVP